MIAIRLGTMDFAADYMEQTKFRHQDLGSVVPIPTR